MASKSVNLTELDKKFLGKQVKFQGSAGSQPVTGVCDRTEPTGAIVILRTDGSKVVAPSGRVEVVDG